MNPTMRSSILFLFSTKRFFPHHFHVENYPPIWNWCEPVQTGNMYVSNIRKIFDLLWLIEYRIDQIFSWAKLVDFNNNFLISFARQNERNHFEINAFFLLSRNFHRNLVRPECFIRFTGRKSWFTLSPIQEITFHSESWISKWEFAVFSFGKEKIEMHVAIKFFNKFARKIN